MARNGSGVYSLPAGSIVTDGDTIEASQHNTPLNDLATDANTARPVVAGGTGATNAADALVNLGLTATAAEINTLDGITATVTELNYTDGVTSSIQTQLDAKAPLASPALTGTPTAPTAAVGTDTTQVATTAFVGAEIAADVGVANSALVKTAVNASGSAPIYACRAWVNFNGTGTVAINGSGNVSSITDNGAGDYTINFTTAMPDANYAVLIDASSSGTTNTVQYTSKFTSRSSSAVRILTLADTTAADFNAISVAIFR